MRCFATVFFLFVSSMGLGVAQESVTACTVYGPLQYRLNSDTVDWTISLARGQSCVRGLQANLTTLDEVKLTSPPQSGQVIIRGPGFIYRADPDFTGQDSFTFAVNGKTNKVPGTSTIHVIVSVR